MSPARMAYRPVVSYAQAHLRVKVDRGYAPEHRCVACSAQAQEWAYRGGDPDELVEPDGKRMRYSLNQNFYQPMCIPCHRRHDRAQADGRTIDFCPHGHPWSVENTGVRRKRSRRTGVRYCRACHRKRARQWRQENPVKRAAYAREYRRRIKQVA